jgi:hypothetical protein
MAQTLILTAARIAATTVFLAAAIPKLRDPQGTLLAIYQYRILSWEASEVFSRLLPWLEFVVAVGLWIPRLALGAAAWGTALNLIFLGAIGSALVRHLDISCGCFGSAGAPASLLPRLLEDVLLLSLFLLLTTSQLRSLQTPSASTLSRTTPPPQPPPPNQPPGPRL